jgi:DNA invertase Pin-like site-specific DNA recombinase
MNAHPFPPGSLVAAYFRDSGGDTQELSVPQQESAFRTWCLQNRLIPGAIFNDIARSGSSIVSRMGFHDMIHHFRSGQAKDAGLVIWSYSRFARDFDDAQFYRADLRRRGYIFYSLNDDIPEGSIGKLFEAVIDWKNEQFLVDLSRDTRRGLHDLVATYGAVPGTPPRGFIREPVTIGKRRNGQDRIAHRWAPNPDELPRIRQAFAMRAAGKTLAEIHVTTHLYGSLNSYQTFFTNKLYIGILEFGDLVIENYCEPVIDRITWETVQIFIKIFAKRLNLKAKSDDTGNPHHPRRINSRYLLSGLLYCARCGSPMFGATAPQRSGKICDRYACARAYRRRDCDLMAVPQKAVEGAVLTTIREYILQPEVMQQHQQLLQNEHGQTLEELDQKRAEINGLMGGVRRRIANVTNAIAESGHSRAMLDKLAALEVEETGFLAQLAGLERQAAMPVPNLTAEQIIDMISNLSNTLESADLETAQRILRGFVSKIVVDRHESQAIGMIFYYYPLENSSNKSPPDESLSVSLSPLSLGAPSHRHSFTAPFTAAIRSYKRKRP